MEQKDFIRNISGTACLLGLALSAMTVNSTMVVKGDYEIPQANYSYFNESSTMPFAGCVSNIYKANLPTNLEQSANALFGEMRDATPQEQASIDKYVKSISKDTGVNFFDIC